MEDYFAQIQNHPNAQSYQNTFDQLQHPIQTSEFVFVSSNNVQQQNESTNNVNVQNNENQFNQFQQDQTTKRIRQEEERVSLRLRQKSERQHTEKVKRRQQGRRQLQQFLQSKRKDKKERSEQNIRKQQDAKKQYALINKEAGWKKVVLNVNLKQGQYKGKKEVNRMREAILHRREDDSR